MSEELLRKATGWWTTAIIDIHPGKIGIRGSPIQELIGSISFVEMIWLMLRGTRPTPQQCSRPRWSLRWITGRRRLRSPSLECR
jgi:citrate synthase